MRGKSESDYRKDAIKIAQDFGYPEEIIQRLKSAKNNAEIEQIMHTARNLEGKR